MAVPVPTLSQVAAGLHADESDARLQECYAAAVQTQARDCNVLIYTEDLAEALHRRVGRLWGTKAHTLGVLDTGPDYGVQYTPRYDPIVDELEAPYRHERTVVA